MGAGHLAGQAAAGPAPRGGHGEGGAGACGVFGGGGLRAVVVVGDNNVVVGSGDGDDGMTKALAAFNKYQI